jgi:hypothetical protein
VIDEKEWESIALVLVVGADRYEVKLGEGVRW